MGDGAGSLILIALQVYSTTHTAKHSRYTIDEPIKPVLMGVLPKFHLHLISYPISIFFDVSTFLIREEDVSFI